MATCSAYLTVAGNVLASVPYFQTGRSFLGWISSGWHMDRKERVREFPSGRKVVDRTIVSRIVRRLESSLLKSGSILAASHYTQRLLDDIAGVSVVKDVLPIPINTDFFSPMPDKRVSGRIGFCGRLSDPRKNLELLLTAVHLLRQSGHAVSVLLMGGEPGQRLRRRIEELDLGDAIELCVDLSPEMVRDKLRTLDVFVLPSHQEDLCIAALEAMACGCPVVSTRCGGPEEFVLDDETGYLVGFDPAELADAVCRVLLTPKLRQRLGAAAREKVVRDYSLARANDIFWNSFDQQFVSPGVAA
jgi:glycosyltransferase involved in cell wall biosynthesis